MPDNVLTILVSNNAYSPGVAPGAALRPRLDEAVLWVHLLGLNERRGPLFWRLARTLVTLLSGRSQVAAWPSRSRPLALTGPESASDSMARQWSRPRHCSSLADQGRCACVPSAVETREARIEMQA